MANRGRSIKQRAGALASMFLLVGSAVCAAISAPSVAIFDLLSADYFS
jgi:hypothetical protein